MKKTKNQVASILKGYAIFNFIVVVIAGIVLSAQDGEPIYFAVAFGVGLVVNFAIYAFGEVIQLLQDIKDNTAANAFSGYTEPSENEIPTI